MPIIPKIILIISTVIAYLILSVGYFYLAQYFFGTSDSHLHHELLDGVGLSVVYGFWPVVLSVGLLTYCKCELPVWLFRVSMGTFFLWLILLLPGLGLF
jgi:hypothetical protein